MAQVKIKPRGVILREAVLQAELWICFRDIGMTPSWGFQPEPERLSLVSYFRPNLGNKTDLQRLTLLSPSLYTQDGVQTGAEVQPQTPRTVAN